ncbi:MAG: hypothetical protein V1735_02300 [Nanoarchaeota archaeon]
MNKKVFLLLVLALLTVSLAGCGVVESLNSTAGGLREKFAGFKFILVNFIAIAAAMFLLQALLMPTSEANKVQRTALQMAILAIAGIFAFQIRDDYIWKMTVIANFLHLKVLINIAVMTIGILVLKELIPFIRNQFKDNKHGNAIVLIAAVGIGIMVAVSPFKVNDQPVTWEQLGDGRDYPYIWQMSSGVKMKYFLLGNAACNELKGDNWWDGGGKYCYTDFDIISEIRVKNPRYMETIETNPDKTKYRWGILRMPFLGIAVALSLILAWTFAFLKFGPEGGTGKFAQWLLAVYLAISMANEGMGIRPAVQLGEMLLFFLFWQGTKAAGNMKGWHAALLSGYVVNYVAVKTFPEHQMLGWMGRALTGGMFLKAIVPIVLVVILIFTLAAGKGGKLKGLMGKEFGRRLLNWATNTKNKLAEQDNWLGRLTRNFKDFSTRGSEPPAMIKNRYKFFVMTNYLERIQTLLEKGSSAIRLSKVVLPPFEGIVKQYNTRDYVLELYRYRRSGSLLRFNFKSGKVEFEKLNFDHSNEDVLKHHCYFVVDARADGSLETKTPSNRDDLGNWNSLFSYTRVQKVIGNTFWVGSGDQQHTIPESLSTLIAQEFTPGANIVQNMEGKAIGPLEEKDLFGQVTSANNVLRTWNRIWTQLFHIHWMLNMPEGGRNHHTGLIVLPGSYYRTWEIYEDPSTGIKKERLARAEWEQWPFNRGWLEVDVRGYEVFNPAPQSDEEKINKELMKTGWYNDDYPTASEGKKLQQYGELGNGPLKKNGVFVRRFPHFDMNGRKQIIIMPGYFRWAQLNALEWEEFNQKDLRYGAYHPHSLTMKDYSVYFMAHNNKNMPYPADDAEPAYPPQQSNPAYDERAFQRPGYFKTQGRFDPTLAEIDQNNPDPAVTSHGLSEWLTWMLRNQTQPHESQAAAQMWIFANPFAEDRDNFAPMVKGIIKEVKKE